MRGGKEAPLLYGQPNDIDLFTFGVRHEKASEFRQLTKGRKFGALDLSGHATAEELDEPRFVYPDHFNDIAGFHLSKNPDNPRAGRHLAALYFFTSNSRAVAPTRAKEKAYERLRKADEKKLAMRVERLPLGHLRQFNRTLSWFLEYHLQRTVLPPPIRTQLPPMGFREFWKATED